MAIAVSVGYRLQARGCSMWGGFAQPKTSRRCGFRCASGVLVQHDLPQIDNSSRRNIEADGGP
jgi:hypothetical protein